ncbi:MAG: hypothetical protein ACHQAX_05215 [Gammaproteobacteria bacterium]
MKKLLILLSILFILGALAVGVVFFKLNGLVKMGIERYGSEITGTPVKLSMAEISPMSGKGSLTNFSIGNPPDFKAKDAFKAEEISIKIDKDSLKTDTIIVLEMSINSPHIDYELEGTSNNFAIIREHINKQLAGSADSKAEHVFDDKVIVINDLFVKNGSINVTAPVIAGGEAYKVVLPDIHLQNLGKGDKPGNLPLIMQRIMAILTGDVMSAVGPVTLKTFDKMVTQGGIINPVNDVQKSVEGVEQGVGKTLESIIPR